MGRGSSGGGIGGQTGGGGNPWRGNNSFATDETLATFRSRYGDEIGTAMYRVALVNSQIANENRARRWDVQHGITPNEFDDARLDDLHNDLVLAQRALRRARRR